MVPWTDFPYVLERIAVSKCCHRRKPVSHTTTVLSEHYRRRKKHRWNRTCKEVLKTWGTLEFKVLNSVEHLYGYDCVLLKQPQHILTYIVILENMWWTLTQKLVYLKVRELAARSVPWVSRIGGSSWHETTLNPAFWWKKSEVEKRSLEWTGLAQNVCFEADYVLHGLV